MTENNIKHFDILCRKLDLDRTQGYNLALSLFEVMVKSLEQGYTPGYMNEKENVFVRVMYQEFEKLKNRKGEI